MTAPAVIKKELQARYDQLGEEAVSAAAQIRDPSRMWNLVEGTRPPLAYFRYRKLETTLALGRFTPGSTLLEVGCGTGDYSLMLARRGFKIIGIDISPRSIHGACAKASILGLSDVSFLVSDAETLSGIADASVDGVVSFSTLRYVPNLDQALGAMRRVLKPRGAAVIDFPNKFCPWFTMLKNHFGVETHIHDHQFATQQIITLMRHSDFEAIVARRILFTPYVLP